MKIKFSPVLYIFIAYICLSTYLIFSYFSFQQYLSEIQVVDLAPIAYGLLILSSIILALSLFSLLRIPFFHYLFKMFHLWIVILCGLILWLYFKYGHMMSDMFNADTQESIAKTFPVTQPDMFTPLINLIQIALKNFKERVVNLFYIFTLVIAVIQIILYLPSSLRYVYHTHISPIKYTLKHIFVSLILLAPALFAANYYFKLDSSLNPELETLLTVKQENIKDTDNAFYPLLTLWLPDMPDRISYGNQWVSEDKRMLAYFRKINKPVKPSEYPGYRKLFLRGMNKEDQAAINQLYIKRLLSNDIKLEKAIYNYARKYQTQLKIVRSLNNYHYYKNPIEYTEKSYTKFYRDYSGSFLSLQRLNLLVSLIEYRDDIKSIVKNMSDEYFYNINIIRSSNDPNVKLVNIEKQTIIVQFLYNLLHDTKFQNKNIYTFIDKMPVLSKVVMSQNPIARKNINLVKSQIDTAMRSLANKQSPSARIIDYAFKYNKTMNCIYEHAKREYNLDDQKISVHIDRQRLGISKSSLGNVIGNIICKASIPGGRRDNYIKAIETNGRIMILKARSKLFEEGINDVNIGAYLTNHSGKYYNPFTAGALKWDREARHIYFEYNNGRENVKVSD